MYCYWRIQQDLSCLGEIMVLHSPSLIRCFQQWVQKNGGAFILAEGFVWKELLRPGMN